VVGVIGAGKMRGDPAEQTEFVMETGDLLALLCGTLQQFQVAA
jgi:hypothetical protein